MAPVVIIEYCTSWVTGICQPQLIHVILSQHPLTNCMTDCDPTGEELFEIQLYSMVPHGFHKILHMLGHRNLLATSMINYWSRSCNKYRIISKNS